MSAITDVINRILGHGDHERIDHLQMDDPIFSELLSIIDAQESISDTELADLHTLLLDDQVCGLIWEDSYPISDTNNADHDKEIGSMDITAIFHRYRPPEEGIIAKKDSPEPTARLFCIWMCTYEKMDDTDYDALAELLLDEFGGVGNLALTNLGEVISFEALYRIIRDYLVPSNNTRDPGTVRWLLNWLNEIKQAVDDFDPNDNPSGYTLEDHVLRSIYDSDDIRGGDTWARVVIALQDDNDLLLHLQ